MSAPDIIQDYGLSLTTPEGVVYTSEKYPWTERDFYLNMSWGYNVFTKPEADLTLADREYLFDKQFWTSLFYGRTVEPSSSHINFTLYKVDGVNLGFSETDYYIDENSVRHIKNVSTVIAPALRGQGHSKYINGLIFHTARYLIPTYSEAKFNIRHGSVATRKNLQNFESATPASNLTVEYNDKVKEFVQKGEYPTQANMTGIFEKIATLGTYSTTDPDEFWIDSPKTDAKWAHPNNVEIPEFSV